VTLRKFAVRSPAAAATPPARRGPALAYARDDAAGSARDAVRPRSVLIVEDDFLVALAAEAALREAGFEVAGVVESAEAAIAEAAAKQPSLVVMDVRLAGRRDGIDAAIQLFREHGIPCIFATAHYDAEAHARARPAKPLGWLQKPYTMPDLVALVRQVTDALGKER
jgi:DNA-binding NarL/FixJ family response regulator